MAGVGDAWGTRESMLHPRDSHGRFRSKWKMSTAVVDKLMAFLGSFNPKMFGNDQEGGGYIQELGRSGRSSPGSTAALGKFLRGTPAVQAKLRSGDTSSPEAKAIDNSMTPLPDDLILTRITGPESWGLTPESIGQIEEYTGHLVADKGYTPATIGTPLPHAGPAITMTIATPAGTKAAIPRSNGGREVILDRDQPLRITKVDSDGKGGFYVLAVAETKGAPGSKRTTPIGGKVPTPQPDVPQPQQAPGAPAAPGTPETPGAVAPVAPAPGVLVPQKKIGRPAGPAPAVRNEGHVAESIGGKPVPQGETPAPSTDAPQVLAEPIPQQPGLPDKPAPDPRSTFRGAFKKADLKSPSEGKRRQQFNEAYLGAATGKKTPQEAVDTLEHHITLNEAILKTDQEDGTDSGPLPGDIKAQKDLAQLIKDHFGLEGAKAEKTPAKKATPAPKAAVSPAPKQESIAQSLSRLNAEEGAKVKAAKADAAIAKGERERKGAIRKEMRTRIPAKAPESDEPRLLAEKRGRQVKAKNDASDAAGKVVADKWLADAGLSRDDLSDFELTGLKVVAGDVASKKISEPEGRRRLAGGKGNLAKIGANAPAKRAAAPKKAAGPLNDDLSNATIAQLREEAKKRGIKIPSSVRLKEAIRHHILGDKKEATPTPDVTPKVEASTTIKPSWATTKGHGGSGIMLYYGRDRKPNAEPRRVKVNFDRGMAHFTDVETGEKIREVGVASKYWAAPDAPLKKADTPTVSKKMVDAKTLKPGDVVNINGKQKTVDRYDSGDKTVHFVDRSQAKDDSLEIVSRLTDDFPAWLRVERGEASDADLKAVRDDPRVPPRIRTHARSELARRGEAKNREAQKAAVKTATPSAPEKASGTAKGKLTAARVAPGTRILVRKDAKGEWAPTSTKTGATAITVTSKDASTAGGRRGGMRRTSAAGYVITGTDNRGNEIKVKPVGGSQTFWIAPLEFKSLEDAKAPRVEAPAKKATPAGPKMSTAPLIENQWGVPGGTVNYHEDGYIGRTVGRLSEEDKHLDVDGGPLANELGMIATQGVRGSLTSQQVVDEIKDVAAKLPEGSAARRSVERLAEQLDAPARPPLDMPKSTPAALRHLMEDFSKIPLARRQGTGRPSEMDKLQAISERFASGEIRQTRLNDELMRGLYNNRHESEEGKFEIDRMVQKAVAALEKKMAADREAKKGPPAVKTEIPASPELQDLVAKTSIADLRAQAKEASIKVPASAKTKQQIVNHIAQALAERELMARLSTDPIKGEAVLAAAPATLTRAKGGHFGDYTGEALDAPEGAGSVRALSEYEGVEYDNTNKFLRGHYKDPNTGEPPTGNEDYLQGTPERIAEIDKTMKVSRLTSDVELHRGIKNGLTTFGDAWTAGVVDLKTTDFDEQDRQYARWEAGERPDLTGLKFTDLGFVSTTADPAVADEFVKTKVGRNYGLEGEPVVMSIIVPKGTGGVQLAEWGHAAEILLERGLSFEVVADHGVDAKGYRRLDVKVVPK